MTPVDPRLDWTVGRDGVPFKDWGAYSIAWVRDPVNGGPYMPKKIIHEKGSGAEATVGWQPQQQSSINIHLYRYADLLLMLAEAEVETGDLAGATAIVNQIRTRAGVFAQGPGTSRADMAIPINDPRITWATVQDWPIPGVPGRSHRPYGGPNRTQARAGDGRSTPLRSAPLWNLYRCHHRIPQR